MDIAIFSPYIFGGIASKLNKLHLESFSLTCKIAYESVKLLKSIGKPIVAGNTTLYPQQALALKWLDKCLSGPSPVRVLLNAYMSFGKTLVALHYAWKTLHGEPPIVGGPVLIIVPGGILRSWQNELKKFYPTAMAARKRAERPFIILGGSISAADKHYACDIGFAGTDDDLARHIFIVSAELMSKACQPTSEGEYILFTYDRIGNARSQLARHDVARIHTNSKQDHYKFIILISRLITNAKLVIFDEAHKTNNLVNGMKKYAKNASQIHMTATPTSEIVYDARYVVKEQEATMLPANIVYNFIPVDSHPLQKACTIIDSMQDSHIVLAIDEETIISDLYLPSKKVLDFNKHKVTTLSNFISNGGVLLTTIRRIAEGNNFNVCNSMVIVLKSEKSTIICSKLKQCVGRIYRESNKHRDIHVTFIYYRDPIFHIRTHIASMPLHGYEVIIRENISKIIKYLEVQGIDMYALSNDELLVLFGYSNIAQVARDFKSLKLDVTLPMHVVYNAVLLRSDTPKKIIH